MAQKYQPRFKPGNSIRAIVDSQFIMYREGDTARVACVDLDDRGIEEGLQVIFDDDGRSMRVLPWNWEIIETSDQQAVDTARRDRQWDL